eukprot:14412626-Alexandrium_andersonii.AAC.1
MPEAADVPVPEGVADLTPRAWEPDGDDYHLGADNGRGQTRDHSEANAEGEAREQMQRENKRRRLLGDVPAS